MAGAGPKFSLNVPPTLVLISLVPMLMLVVPAPDHVLLLAELAELLNAPPMEISIPLSVKLAPLETLPIWDAVPLLTVVVPPPFPFCASAMPALTTVAPELVPEDVPVPEPAFVMPLEISPALSGLPVKNERVSVPRVARCP